MQTLLLSILLWTLLEFFFQHGMLSCPCYYSIRKPIETKSSQKWLYFLDMGWMAWIMVGLTIFFHNMYILALSKATSKAIFFKKTWFFCSSLWGRLTYKHWMRKSKAWYRQVADSKANTNIYERSVQFDDPLDLWWCPKPF